MIVVELYWEHPDDQLGKHQDNVTLAAIPRKDDTIIFDNGDADPPFDGHLEGTVVDVTFWGDGKPPTIGLKISCADPPLFPESSEPSGSSEAQSRTDKPED